MTTEDDHPWPRCNSQNFGLAAAHARRTLPVWQLPRVPGRGVPERPRVASRVLPPRLHLLCDASSCSTHSRSLAGGTTHDART